MPKKNPWSAKNNRVAAAVEAWEPKVAAMADAERERFEADLTLDRQRLTVSSNVLHAAVATKLLPSMKARSLSAFSICGPTPRCRTGWGWTRWSATSC